MIASTEFSKKLTQLNFDTAIGVPDSTFKGLISYFYTQNAFQHITATNECEAMGIAAGYYLGQQKPALVYMQNSGFCKTLNPYTSLLSNDAYSLPTVMLVGWRGEPGKKDEPQHKMMGRIIQDLLKVMELEYTTLEEPNWEKQLETAQQQTMKLQKPYVLLIKKGLFDDFKIPNPTTHQQQDALLTREQALNIIVDNTSENTVFVSTTGKTSRELFEIRTQKQQHHGKDFYTVGSMGCTSAIAFGLGLARSGKKIFILDGDGATLMQLGTIGTIGHYKNNRLKHILIDNNAHESTGGQPTISDSVNFPGIARACGYDLTESVDTEETLKKALYNLETNNKLSLLVVKVKKGSRPDLGRPTTTPGENRDAFIRNFRP